MRENLEYMTEKTMIGALPQDVQRELVRYQNTAIYSSGNLKPLPITVLENMYLLSEKGAGPVKDYWRRIRESDPQDLAMLADREFLKANYTRI